MHHPKAQAPNPLSVKTFFCLVAIQPVAEHSASTHPVDHLHISAHQVVSPAPHPHARLLPSTLSTLMSAAQHPICSGPAYFPFTITILCLKAKILASVKKTGYSQGKITDWDIYQVVGDSILQQRFEESDDPNEAEDDRTEIEREQLVEVPNKAEPTEPEAELEIETLMFEALPRSPDLRDEL
ncbi:hypothetical protein J1N35_007614 [Gossypium stocksii]|uniref:Uncharacterized protein n=1 Tax=Gossypium stocksii TaxID=47602 RepID=A0A9D3W7L9_9ROSI|nr:hypothetical protein J1N35_007614 [Gossypium stocksii]